MSEKENKVKRTRKDLDSSAETEDMPNTAILNALKDLDTRLSSKMDSLESSIDTRFSTRIDTLQSSILTTINGVKNELNDNILAVKTSTDDRFNAVGNTFNALHGRCDGIMSSVNENATAFESRIGKLERHSLMNELIVTGVPIEKRRSADNIVADICDALQCDLRQNDFAAIFRISSRKRTNQSGDETQRTSSPPIILRFNFLWAKNCFLDAYYKKKDLSLKDIGFKTARRIYINESLTATNREIFSLALQLKKSGHIFRCFTRQGLVYVQESESTNSSRVMNKQDLDKFRTEPPSNSTPHNTMDTDTQ